MKKQILFFAVAALALASCSSDKIAEEKQVAQQQAEPGAVLFEAYTQRGVTRAGTVGTLTTDGMKTGAFKNDGFGVFGYYTDNNTYDKLYLPNFMYNEQVKWDGSSAWTYEPVKYWPNEYGNTAISDDQDKVSFFAYAPWVDVVPTTGKLSGDAELQKWGITGMTRNTATGDPLIKYLVSFDPAHSVDLCWGVCDEDVWTKVVDGGNQTFTKGKPWIDVQRPANAVDQKLKFTFKHATSQLNVQVDAYVDGTDNTKPIAAGSKVYIRSITFEGFATQGTLNLNNTDVNPNIAYWLDYAGTNDLVTGETVTIYDGRKDGKEGTIGGEATNEKVLGLNPQLIQSALWSENATTGVTNTTVNLFRKWNDTEKKYEAASLLEPIYVIPTGDKVKVTIVYDIETEDGQLATYLSDAETNGSSIPNTISKNINFGGSDVLQNGLSYTIKLHLGLNSVKFDAAVSDWQEAGGWSQTDLPANVPVYTAINSPSEAGTTISIPANVDTYQFAVSGLTANEALTCEQEGAVTDVTVPSNVANSSGVALATVDITPNKTVSVVETGIAKVKGNSSSKGYWVKFKQDAAPLKLAVENIQLANKRILLTCDNTLTDNPLGTLVTSADNIKVWKNGVQLGYATSTPEATQFLYNSTYCQLTFGVDPVVGDVYTISIKVGDAPEETVTAIVGGISYATATVNKAKGDSKFTNALIVSGKGTIVYESTNPSVATVDAKTGEVTIVNTGTTTIKATFTPASGTFATSPETEDQYTLNVGNVVFAPGSTYTFNSDNSSGDHTIYVSGTSAVPTLVKGEGAVINGPVNASGDGLTTITYTQYSYTLTGARTQNLIVTDGTKSMTIIIKQPGV